MSRLRETRLRLYHEYCRELNRYDPLIYQDKNEVTKWATGYMNGQYDWRDIYVNEKIVGFIILAHKGETLDIHPRADHYIAQTYIQKEYRMKGFMEKYLLENVFGQHKGLYVMLVIDRNFGAKQFWEKILKKAEARPCELENVGAEDENTTQVGFWIR